MSDCDCDVGGCDCGDCDCGDCDCGDGDCGDGGCDDGNCCEGCDCCCCCHDCCDCSNVHCYWGPSWLDCCFYACDNDDTNRRRRRAEQVQEQEGSDSENGNSSTVPIVTQPTALNNFANTPVTSNLPSAPKEPGATQDDLPPSYDEVIMFGPNGRKDVEKS